MPGKTSYIKLDRNILRWRWYKDTNTFRLFIYLLITAAYKDTSINGITVRRGQLLTTYKELAAAHNLSYKTIRTKITKLKETGEITVKRLSKKQLVTLTNYELYQGRYSLAFFIDMTNEGNHFYENGQSLSEKRAITKMPENQLDILEKSGESQGERAITFVKMGNHFCENGQSKEEKKDRRKRKEAKEKEEEKIIRKYKEYNNSFINKELYTTITNTREAEDIKAVIEMYHRICVDYPKVKALSDQIVETLLRSLEKYSLEQFREMFIKAETSHYLRGKNKLKRRANFDWMIEEGNMAKILNGNYDDLPRENSSFDTDEFFEAALKRSYENIGKRRNKNE